MQVGVVGQQFLYLRIRLVDVLRIARQRRPAERADAAAKQRTDIGRNEARKGKGIFQAFVLGDLADVIAVVERRHAGIPERDHRFHMRPHRCAGRDLHRFRIAFALGFGFLDGPADRQVAVARVMGGCLIGDDIRASAAGLHAGDQFGEDFGSIAEQADRFRFARLGPLVDQPQRFVQRLRLGIDITGAQTKIDAGLVAFDREAAGAGHDGCERLCAAHAAEAAGQDPLALEAAAIMLAARFHEGLVGALDDALRADIDPRSGGHLAVHGQALLIQFVEMVPGCPMRHQVGVGDQHARRILVGAEHADRLAGLHEKRLLLR